ncbi:putative transcription factor WD40-like family [Rosa chinensis]|uniref:Putative transcription factor WD40-like family n=1 Tax=Rosa chinensis TaxID=74649 RepID=A0A2P6R766_ROSCH|nr:putative transcription factor WD40-like family [Rosa chinensis]
MDGQTICSSHVDGNLRLWDIQKGKLLNEVAVHSNAVTSISLPQSGNMVLTGGRDNVHHLFDMRFPGVSGTLRATGNRVASNWSLSCISPDDNYVPAGSADGAVYLVYSQRCGSLLWALQFIKRSSASGVMLCLEKWTNGNPNIDDWGT